MFRNPRFSLITVCALALAFARSLVDAQVKPFEIEGGGVAPYGLNLSSPTEYNGTCEATLLGEYCLEKGASFVWGVPLGPPRSSTGRALSVAWTTFGPL